jgi:hypothetical protein
MKIDFDDILIKPAVRTRINSRSQIDILDEQDMLPLFTAPMDTVVSEKNASLFVNNGIKVILPRKRDNDISYVSTDPNCWNSYGLVEFKEIFLQNTPDNRGAQMYALIDVANGHMPALLDAVNEAKNKYNSEIVLMVGNVANPETYAEFSIAGADYVRIGIGNGCFIDGSMVKTIAGEKPIETIVNGDLVLTHRGNYQKVVNTKRFEYSGELIKINDTTICTPDHQFYVLPKKHLDIVTEENIHTLCEWVSAMELYNNSNYLLIEIDSYDEKNSV